MANPIDRRGAARVPDPRCPVCRSLKTRVTLRTELALYFRCEDCGEIWPVQKPHAGRREKSTGTDRA